MLVQNATSQPWREILERRHNPPRNTAPLCPWSFIAALLSSGRPNTSNMPWDRDSLLLSTGKFQGVSKVLKLNMSYPSLNQNPNQEILVSQQLEYISDLLHHLKSSKVSHWQGS